VSRLQRRKGDHPGVWSIDIDDEALRLAVIARQRAECWLPVTEAVMNRALEVIAMLAACGQHRVPISDVIIAATAERHGTTVLHVDSDYDRVATVTGQPMCRLPTSN
jgi:predicted nucleic acid-binding protein